VSTSRAKIQKGMQHNVSNFLLKSCWTSHITLMSRIGREYCLISTSYLVGLFDIFIIVTLYLTEVCVSWWHFTNEDTLWCLLWGIWMSLAFNPGHIWHMTLHVLINPMHMCRVLLALAYKQCSIYVLIFSSLILWRIIHCSPLKSCWSWCSQIR